MTQNHRETVKVKRDVEAVQIPIGTPLKITKGKEVTITQSLGGNYTVITEDGYMAQISGFDADALGKEAVAVPGGGSGKSGEAAQIPLDKMVWMQLKTCYDPEIPVNIVDLGLVYDCKITPTDDGKNIVDVKMTLTAPGCGMGGPIAADAKSKIERIPGVKEAHVDVVWDPPWDRDKMSEAAKLQLGMM